MRENREKAANEFRRDLAVDASAGTGKTSTLVARVTNLFLARPDLSTDQVLLLTFTDKAAAEMKARVTEGWERLFAATQETDDIGEVARRAAAWNPLARVPAKVYPDFAALRRRVEEMVDGVGRLSVTTFHSFCARVLRSFPAEAGVDPLFEVLPETAAADAWDAAFRRFLQGEFGMESVLPEWERILSAPSRSLQGVVGDPPPLPLPARSASRPRAGFRVSGGLPRLPRPGTWPRRGLFPRLRRRDPGAGGRPGSGGVPGGAPRSRRGMGSGFAEGSRRRGRACGGRDRGPFRWISASRQARRNFPVPGGRNCPRCATRCSASGSGWPRCRKGTRRRASSWRGPAPPSLASRRRKGAGSISWTCCCGRAIFSRGAPRSRGGSGSGSGHIFVDEFQDTDPLQAGVLRAIAADAVPGRLFVVGDPKQSIYGFRRADIQVYRKFRRGEVDAGGEDVPLARNFRSRPDLLATLSGLFSRVLSGGEDFSPGYAHVEANRNDPGEGHPVSRSTGSTPPWTRRSSSRRWSGGSPDR